MQEYNQTIDKIQYKSKKTLNSIKVVKESVEVYKSRKEIDQRLSKSSNKYIKANKNCI